MCVGEEEQSRVADKNNAGNRNPAEREGGQVDDRPKLNEQLLAGEGMAGCGATASGQMRQ
ncbi:hypothetical protein An12g03690 [Aspergillus niger]|uniref:Uncharacterized protein n=2 Tax=Aspergillus niger TaxID=5061 RepID=A2QZ55_ASPNC|nr:hypothetical protein An12g03690 [Aspergillus niger]CAK46140.1 hypothetical protein An12g03690 [Aspergillus niger]